MKYIRTFVVLCLLAGLGLTVASSAPAKIAGSEIRIGALLSKTGILAYYGDSQEIALNIALEEINGAGGIDGVPVKVIFYDTASKGDTAISVAKRLIDSDHVLAILGPMLSSSCRVVFPVVNRDKVPTISASCAAPGLAKENRPWTFQYEATSDKLTDPIVERFKRDTKATRVALIHDNKDVVSKLYATLVAPVFLKKHGIEIITTQTFVTTDIDYSAQVTAMKAAKPEAVVIGALPIQAAHVAREMKKQGFNVPILGDVPISGPQYTDLGKDATEGTYAVSELWYDKPSLWQREFIKKFKERHKQGHLPHTVATSMYDATHVMKWIIETRGVTNKPEDLQGDREKIRKGWAEMKDYPSMVGRISMNEHGEALREFYLLKVVKGAWQRLF